MSGNKIYPIETKFLAAESYEKIGIKNMFRLE